MSNCTSISYPWFLPWNSDEWWNANIKNYKLKTMKYKKYIYPVLFDCVRVPFETRCCDPCHRWMSEWWPEWLHACCNAMQWGIFIPWKVKRWKRQIIQVLWQVPTKQTSLITLSLSIALLSILEHFLHSLITLLKRQEVWGRGLRSRPAYHLKGLELFFKTNCNKR